MRGVWLLVAGACRTDDPTPSGETADTAPSPPDSATSPTPTTPSTTGDTAATDTAAPTAPIGTLVLTGDVTSVHDPAVIDTGTGYLLFSTGQGISVRESADLQHWTYVGSVFPEKPSWITTTDPGDPNALWAPDVSSFGGQYHLYYSASSFGSNTSCIGHATSPTIDPPVWTDDGEAVICSTSADAFNAIDPAASVDTLGRAWLTFGSFWSGIKILPLQSDGRRDGTVTYSLSARPNTAVEAPFVVRHGEFYYLFQSVDYCCRGVDSTYKQVVGRSAAITGPYVDRVGVPMLSGGGTLLVEGDERWRGPGHNAVLETAEGTFNLYHAYDADNGGVPTLRIAELTWADDGWPVSAGP